MEIIIFFNILLITLLIIKQKQHRQSLQQFKYQYSAKDCIVTKAELNFYQKLKGELNEKHIIIPQAHLSSFLWHNTTNQNYRIAFSKINGKSVDFLICTKETLKPVVAIEIDDRSHHRLSRIKRDAFVNEVLSGSGIRLIRLRANEWGGVNQIKQKAPELF